MIEIFLLAYAVITAPIIYLLAKKCLELNEKLEDVNAQVGDSLDILDDCYSSVYQKSKLEVMSDEPVIRELISDITRSRNAILLVSRKINGDNEDEET